MSKLQSCEIADPLQWDTALVGFPGSAHPLQSWAWGEAKRIAGEHIERWMVVDGDRPVLLAQVVEKRVTPLGIRMAWVARGPVIADGELGREAFRTWKKIMARRGYRLAGFQPYRVNSNADYRMGLKVPRDPEYTYLVNLTKPLDELDKSLDKEWRYGKNRFGRDGGIVAEDSSPETLEALIAMLSDLAERKGFPQYGDAAFLRAANAQFALAAHPQVSAHLFRATVGEKTAGCAFVLRVGEIAHYNWGAFDYELRNARVNEGLQWGIMQHLREMGVTTYDLEGADLKRNPGVYHFKRRMGGQLVRHSPYQVSLLI